MRLLQPQQLQLSYVEILTNEKNFLIIKDLQVIITVHYPHSILFRSDGVSQCS